MSYVPNIYMKTEELVALVKASAEMGGIYANHARTMNGTDPEAITEAVEVAERAGSPLHFFHLNSTSSTRADEFLAIIDEARARGMKVSGDSYTYTWGITGLASYIPAWAQEGGREAMLERLRDPEQRTRIAADFVDEPPYLANIGWHRVRLGVNDPEVNGKLVEEVSEIRQQPPEDRVHGRRPRARGAKRYRDRLEQRRGHAPAGARHSLTSTGRHGRRRARPRVGELAASRPPTTPRHRAAVARHLRP